MRNVAGRREMHTVRWGNRKEGDHLEDLRVDGKVILIYVLKE